MWRRRRCLACQSVFTTHEQVELQSTLSVDKKGSTEPFEPGLLQNELVSALSHRKDVYTASDELLGAIVRRMLILPQKPLYKASDISLVTADVLERFDRRAYLRYLADHPSLQ